MQSFLSILKEGHRVYDEAITLYSSEPGLYPSSKVKKKLKKVYVLASRVQRCLDLSQVPPTLVNTFAMDSMLLLKTILDRIEIPPLQSIPDAEAMEAEGLSDWQLPHTEITISKVHEGPRKGEFLFSPATLDRLEVFYERVQHLPYKPGAWENVYSIYKGESGPLIPKKIIWQIPPWGKMKYKDYPLWKWVLLGFVIFFILGVIAILYRLLWTESKDGTTKGIWRRTLFPISVMFLILLLDNLQRQIAFRGEIYEWLTTLVQGFFFLATGWAILIIGHTIGESIIASPRIKTKSLDAALIRVTSTIISFAIAAWVVIEGARFLGVPVVPVLAGLGVGGLALALAAQSTIENFLGGLTLFADRPVRVGDFCKFGDKLGVVEEIGLRSTRVRTLARTLVTVPNAEFAKLHLENYTKRDQMWYHPRLQLRYETTEDQIRYILVEVRKILYAHPKVSPDPARIRFVAFGSYSLDLDIYAYIEVTDYGEFLEVSEDLNLRIMGIVKKAGTGLAIPAWRSYVQEGEELDTQRIQDTEKKVKTWKETKTLYIPKFPEEKIEELQGSLDYPPEGSPSTSSKP